MLWFEAFLKDDIVTKFEITVVFLLPVGSLLAAGDSKKTIACAKSMRVRSVTVRRRSITITALKQNFVA